MRARSKFGLPVVLIALFSAITLAAWAAWTAPGTGAGAAKATMVNAGNTPTVSANSSAVTVSWAQSTLVGGGAVDGYVVKRYNASDVLQSIGANCSGTITALTCTENNVPSGTWKYSVTPKKASWNGAESAKASVTVSATAPTVAVAFPASGGAYRTATWSAGCATAGICGTASATSPATVSNVKVSVRQGTGNYWSGSGSSFTSAPEVLVTATGTTTWNLNFPATNFPADGSYTVHVVATDSSAASSSVSRTFTIDNTAPTVALSLTSSNAYLSGSVVSYKANAAGGFTLAATVSDTGSGPASASYPAIGTTGWTHGAETISTPAGGPFVSSTFSWNANPTPPGSYTVTGTDAAGNAGTASVTFSVDNAPPTLSTLEMFDTNGNGKVDHVKATFNESLASYSAPNSVWTLTNVPSGGTLNSVSVSGAVATLTLNEGAGAADTSVSSFTVALAANTSGIRDLAGNQSSFAATAPADKAAPVPVAVTLTNGGSNLGMIDDKKDSLTVTFSEALSATSICSAANPNSGAVVMTITDGGGSASDSLTSVTDTACPLHIGTVILGGNYVTSATAAWGVGTSGNNSAISISSASITVTFGGLASGTPNTAAQSAGTPVFTPDTAITDAAGNHVAGTAFVAPAASRF